MSERQTVANFRRDISGFLEVSKTIVLPGVRYSFYLDTVVLELFKKEREEKGFVLSYLEYSVSRVF